MLTAYSLTKKLRSKVKPLSRIAPQAAFFTLFRFLRLTPVYAFIMFSHTFIAPQLGSGPFWYKMISEANLCVEHWWTNLLYINNFLPSSFHSQCMSWTWYLANDMQFFIFALFLINVYIRHQKIAVGMKAILVVSQTLLGYFVLQNNMANFQDWYYDKPYMRVVPLVAGLLMGCALRDTKMAKIKLSPILAASLMLLSIGAILFLCIINSTEYIDHGNPLTATQRWTEHQAAAYATIGRLLFVIALSTISFLCISGNGGFVARFLGMPWWEPLGKLTYGAYLIHPSLLRVYYFQQVHYFYMMSHLNMVVNFLGIGTLAYLLSTVTYVMIELPFEGLFKMLLL